MTEATREDQLILFIKSKGSCPSRSNNFLWPCPECIFNNYCPGKKNYIYQAALKECIQQGLLTDAEIFEELL